MILMRGIIILTMLTNTQEFLKQNVPLSQRHLRDWWKFTATGPNWNLTLTPTSAPPMTNDVINHPAHYIEGRKYEPIAVIEDWNLSYHLGNALKYISRAGRKDKSAFKQDLEKAIWYLQRATKQDNKE